MKDDGRLDLTIICCFAFMAALAIMTSVITIAPSVRIFAAIGGILLGPGILAYRIATGTRWAECVAVGVGVNVATLMILGMLGLAIHYWHPMQLQFLIPLTTLVLAITLLRANRQKESIVRSRTTSRTTEFENEPRRH